MSICGSGMVCVGLRQNNYSVFVHGDDTLWLVMRLSFWTTAARSQMPVECVSINTGDGDYTSEPMSKSLPINKPVQLDDVTVSEHPGLPPRESLLTSQGGNLWPL